MSRSRAVLVISCAIVLLAFTATAAQAETIQLGILVDASGSIHSSTVGYTTKPGIEARLWAARRLGADATDSSRKLDQ